MNIFILSSDPVLAAQYQCDKHVPKMVLESAQMLCLALPKNLSPYKQAYQHHPCSVWALSSKYNYLWLLNHAKALSDEYTFRFEKTHACRKVIGLCEDYFPQMNFSQDYMTPFAQAMPEQYKSYDAVMSYRSYYKGDKIRFAKWIKGRPAPQWW